MTKTYEDVIQVLKQESDETGFLLANVVNFITKIFNVSEVDVLSDVGVVKRFDKNIIITRNQDWIPMSWDTYPRDGEHVQVTYLSYKTKAPLCHAFAYRHNGKWRWSDDDEEVVVEITAWKPNCKPYTSEE